MSERQIQALAVHLERAEFQAVPVVKITDDYPQLNYVEAYAIQDEIRRIKEQRGQRVAGLKMGLTSRAKMEQMGVKEAIRGFLTDAGKLASGGIVDTSQRIHPKLEAEIAFVLGRRLEGPNLSASDVLDATEYVVPALEIIDSRYENFRFALRSVVADNCSFSAYVVGSQTQGPRDIDILSESVAVELNGEIVQRGTGSAVLGDPALSVAMLAKMLSARQEVLEAGTFILTGGITPAVRVNAGDHVVVHYDTLGDVDVRFS